MEVQEGKIIIDVDSAKNLLVLCMWGYNALSEKEEYIGKLISFKKDNSTTTLEKIYNELENNRVLYKEIVDELRSKIYNGDIK